MKTQSIQLPKGINEGMPPLEVSENVTSFFEFWPAWAMYTPVILQWLILSARYRSLSLPLIANPSIPLSGMVGESKSDILELASDSSSKSICQFTTYHRSQTASAEDDSNWRWALAPVLLIIIYVANKQVSQAITKEPLV